MPLPLPLPALVPAVLLLAAGDARADDRWRITIPEAVDAEIEAAAAVSLSIAPREGYTISRDGPLLIELSAAPADALALPRRRLQRRDAADAAADAPRFDLRFKARREGDHRLDVSLRFWICARRTCRPVRTQRSVTIRARPPAPPPAPAAPATAGSLSPRSGGRVGVGGRRPAPSPREAGGGSGWGATRPAPSPREAGGGSGWGAR